MNRLKRYVWAMLGFIGNDRVESKIKESLKKIYFVLPFGLFAFLFVQRDIRNKMKLIFGMNYHYDLKGDDYASPNLDMRLSKISLWGGV